ncbi:MAG: hypothetical protein EBX50_17480, partial [Chitinophagia bacterium]|nr:hypothetical protein [Chitinophagia bacterium]
MANEPNRMLIQSAQEIHECLDELDGLYMKANAHIQSLGLLSHYSSFLEETYAHAKEALEMEAVRLDELLLSGGVGCVDCVGCVGCVGCVIFVLLIDCVGCVFEGDGTLICILHLLTPISLILLKIGVGLFIKLIQFNCSHEFANLSHKNISKLSLLGETELINSFIYV